MNIKEIITNIRNAFKEEDYSQLTEIERFAEIRMHKVPQEVYNYLKNLFDNLHIEIVGRYEGNLMDLMERGALEGWCWQTTETASLFLPDDSYIERGHLKFSANNLSLLSKLFDVTINNAQAINKSYPTYFDDLSKTCHIQEETNNHRMAVFYSTFFLRESNILFFQYHNLVTNLSFLLNFMIVMQYLNIILN